MTLRERLEFTVPSWDLPQEPAWRALAARLLDEVRQGRGFER